MDSAWTPGPRPSRDTAGSTAARAGRTRNSASGKAGHLLDHTSAIELGVLVRVGGFLPGAGALEADVMRAQDHPQAFASDLYASFAALDTAVGVPVGAQVGGEVSARSTG